MWQRALTVGGGGGGSIQIISGTVYGVSVLTKVQTVVVTSAITLKVHTEWLNGTTWSGITYPIKIDVNGTTIANESGTYTYPISVNLSANDVMEVYMSTRGNTYYGRVVVET